VIYDASSVLVEEAIIMTHTPEDRGAHLPPKATMG
jgi:hypothetical protein